MLLLNTLVEHKHSGLMKVASYQTFHGKIKHMPNEIKFGQTNFVYIINGNFMEFAKENECLDKYQSLIIIISTDILRTLSGYTRA